MTPERLVFIDETGAATNMARRYGRCRRGQRLVTSVPWGHWKTTTFVAALRLDQVTAPCVLDGPIDGASFRAYVEQCLVPTLRPGDIVVMDNLASHKVAGISTRSKRSALNRAICRRTAPISTRSSSSSPSSKLCCERRPPERSMPSSPQSLTLSPQ